jgi:hypothetical protein
MPSVVEDIITRGSQSPGNTIGTNVYQTDQLKVITNQSGGVVTTITQ